MSSAGRVPRNTRGFTLVELLVVLGIIAMLALLVVPRLGLHSPTLQLRSGAEELRNDIRRVRNIALRENRESTITFDVASRSWRGAGGQVLGRMPDDIGLEVVVARQERRGDSEGGVRFYPDGTSTGGTVTLTHADQSLVVSIDWFDGNVSVFEDTTR